ncbi:MAG: DNA mismatch repair endonuclease MutL [Verrucomicrobiales bacterium]
MPKIHVMPDSLASQVAAGEVVERPASVVKELLENSIDAGASRIQIDIERGGASLIRIADDGSGMSRDDALLSMERHATSKLRNKSDLACITTYGFRGEALPSIASVSRFRLVTCEKEALVGTEILIEGGKLKDVGDCGKAHGSQVEVRTLFYNVPARRKFLRAEATEFGHIEVAVRVAAIARPDIAFALRHGQRQVFQLAPTSKRIDRISDLVGVQLAENLIDFTGCVSGKNLKVFGWISEPGFARRNRRRQYSFLNGRPIDSATVRFALRDAYSGLIDRGACPSAFVFIEADPSSVDINVHPAKREVRFHDKRAVQELVAESVQAALAGRMNVKIPDSAEEASSNPSAREISVHDDNVGLGEIRDSSVSHAGDTDENFSVHPEVAVDATGVASAGKLIAREREVDFFAGDREDFRILGVFGERYVVLEGPEGLVLLHRRAAHERILYEEGLQAVVNGEAPSQALLVPATMQMVPLDYQVAFEHAASLGRLGVRISPFGENTLKIDALPAACGDADPVEFVSALIVELREGGHKAARRFSDHDLAVAVSSRAARYREARSLEELSALVVRLMECEMPYCDARGRATMIQFSGQELARRFGENAGQFSE